MKRLIPLLLATAGFAFYSTAAQATYYLGRIDVTVYITITTPIPSGDEVGCSSTTLTDDTLGANTELVYGTASVYTTSPLVYKCELTTYWEWNLGSPTTDTVGVTVGVGYLPTGATTLTGLVRSGTHTFSVSGVNLSQNPTVITETVYTRL
jgi:hypothetical protein